MNRVEVIKKLYEKGKSLREIVDITGHAFETVQKYAYMDDFTIKNPLPQTRESKLTPFKYVIDKWLEEDLTVRRKQRHSAQRVHDRLEEMYGNHFNVSERSIRKYVAQKKKELKLKNKCFIPLEHPPGEAQADFGRADFIENGIKYEGYSLNLSFPYSNAGYSQLFKSENQECLLQGLQNIFEHIGGVPVKIWFDNPKTIVIKLKEEGKRVVTQGFKNFELHYNYDSNFCNANSGHEKGSVESKVGFHTRNLFVPVPKFKDINAYNKELLLRCDNLLNKIHYKKDILISELFNEDKKAFNLLPNKPFEVFKIEKAVTNKYGKVKFDKKIYSSTPDFTQKQVWIKASAHKIEILDDKYNLIQSHKRLYGSQKESMKWAPYLNLIAQRPTSLRYTGFFNELPQTVQEYFEQCDYQYKKTALRTFSKMVNNSDIETASIVFELSIEKQIYDTESLWSLFHTLTSNTKIMGDLKLENPKMPNLIPFDINMNRYDKLLKGGEKLCSKR